jgi:FkbM family methyltransferase
MLHKVTLRKTKIEVDLTNDYYGAEYWDKITTRTYEPDTVGFIEDHCDKTTDFFDIGTANGAMALLAAEQGAQVFAYEPDPTIFKVAERNFILNPHLLGQIKIQNIALSSQGGSTSFGSSSDNTVLSSIVTAGGDFQKIQSIKIESLISELSKHHNDSNRKLVIKMDIEGAEWKILQNRACLEALSNQNALLLLAVHPGFYRPFARGLWMFNAIRYKLWQLRNYRESLNTYSMLSLHAIVMRTNLNPIKRARVFAALVLVGYHEFIVDFDPHLRPTT